MRSMVELAAQIVLGVRDECGHPLAQLQSLLVPDQRDVQCSRRKAQLKSLYWGFFLETEKQIMVALGLLAAHPRSVI